MLFSLCVRLIVKNNGNGMYYIPRAKGSILSPQQVSSPSVFFLLNIPFDKVILSARRLLNDT